jgi:ferredoxin
VCPARAIKFVGRWDNRNLKGANDPPTGETPFGRRGFLAWAAGTVAGAVGGLAGAAAIRLPSDPDTVAVVRPPGSVPEEQFLQLCIRCGACFQACPNNVLQPLGFDQRVEGLWTPRVAADWSGCEPSCANCGQVCPTGAIRALPLEEKRVARMGLAEVNTETCLPHAGREDCQLCVDECETAGYHAIEFVRVGTRTDPAGEPIPDSGFLAPVVLADKCVGCGLCQTRCWAINAKGKALLHESAIQVVAGEGREDRLMRGSYVALRQQERRRQEAVRQPSTGQGGDQESYLPDFLK